MDFSALVAVRTGSDVPESADSWLVFESAGCRKGGNLAEVVAELAYSCLDVAYSGRLVLSAVAFVRIEWLSV